MTESFWIIFFIISYNNNGLAYIVQSPNNQTICLGEAAVFTCVINEPEDVDWKVNGNELPAMGIQKPGTDPSFQQPMSILQLSGDSKFSGASVECFYAQFYSEPALLTILGNSSQPNITSEPISAICTKLRWDFPPDGISVLSYSIEVGNKFVIFKKLLTDTELVYCIPDPCEQYYAVVTAMYKYNNATCLRNVSVSLVGAPPSVPVISICTLMSQTTFNVSIYINSDVCSYQILKSANSSNLPQMVYPNQSSLVLTLPPNEVINLTVIALNSYGNASNTFMLSTQDIQNCDIGATTSSDGAIVGIALATVIGITIIIIVAVVVARHLIMHCKGARSIEASEMSPLPPANPSAATEGSQDGSASPQSYTANSPAATELEQRSQEDSSEKSSLLPTNQTAATELAQPPPPATPSSNLIEVPPGVIQAPEARSQEDGSEKPSPLPTNQTAATELSQPPPPATPSSNLIEVPPVVIQAPEAVGRSQLWRECEEEYLDVAKSLIKGVDVSQAGQNNVMNDTHEVVRIFLKNCTAGKSGEHEKPFEESSSIAEKRATVSISYANPKGMLPSIAAEQAITAEKRASVAEERIQIAEMEIIAAETKTSVVNSKLTAMEEKAKQVEDTVKRYQEHLHALNGKIADLSHMNTALDRRATTAEQQVPELTMKTSLLQEELSTAKVPSWVVKKEDIVFTDKEIGQGSYGIVKVAEFRGLDVVAKFFHKNIISAYNRQQFKREMDIFAQIRHPNIVLFIGATVDEEYIILTELMHTSLRAVLEDKQSQGLTMTRQQVSSIATDVGKALNYLHLWKPNAIIHRDVSSSNVLLESSGADIYKAKVSDVCLSNFACQVRTAAPGSFTYAAPESADPEKQSPKMDIFSYGVLLLEVSCTQFPDNRQALICKLSWPALKALIEDCTAKEPQLRPNMADVLNRLSRI